MHIIVELLILKIQIVMIPNEIEIVGQGVTRHVWVDGDLLEGNDYNWGYTGSQPLNLSKAILSKFFNSEEVQKYAIPFQNLIIRFLPSKLRVKVKLKKWVEAYDGRLTKTHAFDFIQVGITHNLFISKFLDFPSLPYKEATFSNGTIEYDLLKKLREDHPPHWDIYAKWLKTSTLTLEGIGDNAQEVWAYILYDDRNDVFSYKKGFGSLSYAGTKKI